MKLPHTQNTTKYGKLLTKIKKLKKLQTYLTKRNSKLMLSKTPADKRISRITSNFRILTTEDTFFEIVLVNSKLLFSSLFLVSDSCAIVNFIIKYNNNQVRKRHKK